MRTYRVVLHGNKLLMNPMSNDTLEDLRTRRRPQKRTDLTRRDEAAPKIYRGADGGTIILPTINLLAALVHAGRYIKAGTSKVSTAKTTNLFGFMGILGDELKFLVYRDGKYRPATDDDWTADVRKGKNPNGGEAVAIVRPKFLEWGVVVTLWFDDDQVKLDLIKKLMETAGRVSGLGDFRPNTKGDFGMFTDKQWVAIENRSELVDEEREKGIQAAALSYLEQMDREENEAA